MNKPDPAVVASQIAQVSRQVPRDVVARDMCSMIKQGPWSEIELDNFYLAIIQRLRSKSCVRCGKLRVVNHEGSVIEFMDQRHFVCYVCQEFLGEKKVP